jgi:signal transduction histidine kinase/CheY-like chemotaxis protein
VDIAADPLWADFADLAVSHGLRACWSVPILSAAGDVLGTFAMYHRTPRHPHAEDLHLVDIVTRTAAIAIERQRSEDARERRARQAQRLADISARINAAHDVHSVVGVVTEEARRLIGAKQAATSMVLDPRFPEPLNVVCIAPDLTEEVNPDDVDGRKLYEVVHQEHRPIRLSRDALATDPRWKLFEEVALVRPTENGWLAAPLVGRYGKSLGLLQLADKEGHDFSEDDEVMLVQLSRLASIAIENARLYGELRANDRRKDEFLAMLAHELRNPLSAIGNAVTLTTRTGFQEHIEWSMDVITRQMKHLTRLIDDLMDVSRINRGKIELRKDVLDATPILDSAVATVRPLAEERKHTLEVAIDRGNLWVNADPTRLEQVVVNLLNNAAKYSENAGHIRLSAENRGDGLVISIQDKGVGIPPEKLPEMFELFSQGDRSLARSEGGLGIGLTVVKKLVEMHGGTITAKSEGLGKGSEFVIRLPAVNKPAKVRPSSGGQSEKPVKKARILVVDDNVDTARGMGRLLKLIGHEVSTAHNGPEAIEVAKGFNPDFILLDIGLPGMSGYEVALQLRQEECCKDAVIVAISGYGQDEDRRRSKEAGFDHHLIKPLDHDALLTLLSAGPNGRG